MPYKPQSAGNLHTSERRLYPRRNVFFSRMQLEDDNGGIILNISERGLAMQAVRGLRDDPFPQMRFQFSQTQNWVETRGRIAWISASRNVAGIEFVGLADKARDQIKEWISTEARTNQSSVACPPSVAGPEREPSLDHGSFYRGRQLQEKIDVDSIRSAVSRVQETTRPAFTGISKKHSWGRVAIIYFVVALGIAIGVSSFVYRMAAGALLVRLAKHWSGATNSEHAPIAAADAGSPRPSVPPDESRSRVEPNRADLATSGVSRETGPRSIAPGDRGAGFAGDEGGTNAASSPLGSQRDVAGTPKRRPGDSENANGSEPEVASARNRLRNAGVTSGKISIDAEPDAQKESHQSDQKTEPIVPLTTSSPPAPSRDSGTSSPETSVMVFVTSHPDGAEINVDDSFVGKAPMTLKLKPGKHAIRMFMNNYHNWSQWITIDAGADVQVTATLEKLHE